MPITNDDTYSVTCRDGRGDVIEVIYSGDNFSESYQRGAAHMNDCTHADGRETVSIRTDRWGMAHVSGRWGRRQSQTERGNWS